LTQDVWKRRNKKSLNNIIVIIIIKIQLILFLKYHTQLFSFFQLTIFIHFPLLPNFPSLTVSAGSALNRVNRLAACGQALEEILATVGGNP